MAEEKTATEIAEEAAKKVAEEASKKAAEEEAAKKKKEEEEFKNQTPEQKQKAYYERKVKEAEKQKEKAKALEEELALLKGEDVGNVDDKINKAIAARLHIDAVVTDFIKKYPDLEEDRETILQHAHDPSRSGLPIENVISEAIGFEKALKLGAKIQEKINEDTKDGKFGGDSKGTQKEIDANVKKAEEYTAQFMKLPFMKTAKESVDKQ